MESPRGLSARNDGVSPLFNIFWRIWPMRVAPWLLTSMILAATPFPIGAQSAPEGDFNLPPELTQLGPTDPSGRKATAGAEERSVGTGGDKKCRSRWVQV